MEAAGLVLGVIPLTIQGLTTYRNILSSIRTAKRDLDCLIRDLETEQQILQNTCEILLKGIAPDSVLDAMIEKPFGANWDVYNDEVRLRLWPSATLFKERIEEMLGAAVELQRRLAIDGNGKVSKVAFLHLYISIRFAWTIRYQHPVGRQLFRCVLWDHPRIQPLV